MHLRTGFFLLLGAALAAHFPAASQVPPAAIGDQPRIDSYGDPLPVGAVARLGTNRLRSHGFLNAVLSPDGKHILAGGGGRPGTIDVVDAATGAKLRHLDFGGAVTWASNAVFSPDGKRVAASESDLEALSTVVIWDFATGKQLQRLEGKIFAPVGLTFADNGNAVVGFTQMGKVHEWDLRTGKQTLEWDAFVDLNTEGRGYGMGVPRPITFSKDGSKMGITAELFTINGRENDGADYTAAVWDIGRRKLLWRVDGLGLGALSVDEKTVLLDGGFVNGQALSRACEFLTGKEVKRLPNNTDKKSTFIIAFAPDGIRALVTNEKEVFQVLDWRTGKVDKELDLPKPEGDPRRRATAVFFPDNDRILLKEDGILHIWSSRTGRELLPMIGHRSPVKYLAFSANGKELYSGSSDLWERINHPRRLLTWDTRTWKNVAEKVAVENRAGYCVPPMSLDLKMAVGIGRDNSLHLYDTANKKPIRQLDAKLAGNSWDGRGFFSPDGKMLLLVTDFTSVPEPVVLIDVNNGKTLRTLPPRSQKLCFAFGPGNRQVAWFEPDGTICLFDVGTGKVVWKLGKALEADYNGSPARLEFSADGRFLASCFSSEPTIHVWNLHSGKQFRDLNRELGQVIFGPYDFIPGAFAFSADGRSLVMGGSATSAASLQIWEISSAKVRRHLDGHTMPISALAFSPDGRLLASGSEDTTILVWDWAALPRTAPTAADIKQAWIDLGDSDAEKAFRAVLTLEAAPKDTVEFLKTHLKPVAPVKPERLEQLVKELGDQRFAVRDKANAELERLGELARAALRKAAADNQPLELKQRFQDLVRKLNGPPTRPEALQSLRSVEVLERIGTLEARQVLKSLADGAPNAVLTLEAKAALDHLEKTP